MPLIEQYTGKCTSEKVVRMLYLYCNTKGKTFCKYFIQEEMMKMKTFFAAAFAALMAVGAASAQTKSKSLVLYFSLAGGLPNFSRQAITGAALVLLNITAAKCGESMIAALTISSKIVAVAFMIMIGWGQGFQPICAMNYGAQQYERVKKAFITTVAVGTLFLTVASIILYIFAEHWMQLMSNDDDVVSTGIKILRMQCFSLPLLGAFAVSSMFMQNIGNYLSALLISISRQGLFYVPLLYLLPALYGRTGIYLLQPVSDFLSFLFAVAVMFRWYRKLQCCK